MNVSEDRSKLNILKDPRIVKFGLGSWSRNQCFSTNQEHNKQRKVAKSHNLASSKDSTDGNIKTSITTSENDDLVIHAKQSNTSTSTQTEKFHVLMKDGTLDLIFENGENCDV